MARSCFPLSAVSKKQGSVSHSTPEADILAADHAIHKCGFPAWSLWREFLGREPELTLLDGNETTCRIIRTGNTSMRHLLRTHEVAVCWMHEAHARKQFLVKSIKTAVQCADIFTKSFSESSKWQHARQLINVLDPATLQDFLRQRYASSLIVGGVAPAP